MPRVTMVTLSAGPEGVRHPGAVHEVTEAEAHALVAARAAVRHEPLPKAPRESAVIAPRENAAVATKPPAPHEPARGRR
jgi:hypothetical protein